MKIRTKLILLSVLFVILVIVIGSIMFLTFRKIQKEVDSGQSANEIMKHIFELNTITYDYLMHHAKRMEQQWKLKYNSLGKMVSDRILEKEKKGYQEELSILKSIDKEYQALGDLFSSLRTNFMNRKTLIKDKGPKQNIDLTFALEERLAAQLMISTRKIATEAFQLFTGYEKKDNPGGTAEQSDRLILYYRFCSLVILCFIFGNQSHHKTDSPARKRNG